MLYTIQNDVLSVSANDYGAELSSILYNGSEYIWSGSAEWWAGRAPVLFPIVGNLRGGVYTHNSQKYSMTNHGFARRSQFELAEKTDTSVAFSLHNNEDTLAVYPFEFELQVSFALEDSSVVTKYRVINQSQADMFFSFGGHPAFNCPLIPDESFEDYEIVFDCPETVGTQIVDGDGLVSDEAEPFLNNTNTISLNHDLFTRYQTLVFTGLKSNTATMRSRKTGAGVVMDFSGFPIFSVWTKPGAPFLCLEPCQGINDAPDFTGDLCDKKEIVKLAAAQSFESSYSITPLKAQV